MLNDGKIKSARARDKKYKLFDGSGLFVQVNVSGSKVWRFRYQYNTRTYELVLGKYPALSLLDARQLALQYRQQLARGQNPYDDRKKQQLETKASQYLLAQAIEACLERKINRGCGELHIKHTRRMLCSYLPIKMRQSALNQITTQDYRQVLDEIVQLGRVSMALRLRGQLAEIYDLAIIEGRATYNPVEPLKRWLRPKPVKNFARITNPKRLGQLLRAIDAYDTHWQIKLMLQLLPLVFVRQTELRQMEWAEIDFTRALWSIPAEKMKRRRPHLVPLSRQSLAILTEAMSFSGATDLVFKPVRAAGNRIIAATTIGSALNKLGFAGEMTGHGFRGTAATLLSEQGIDSRYTELQLAHVQGRVQAAYNHAIYLEQRREMMQFWADYLDQLKQQ